MTIQEELVALADAAVPIGNEARLNLREAAALLDEAERVVEGLLKCAGRRRPDGHYEFCLVPNRDVEAAKDLITKLRKEKG